MKNFQGIIFAWIRTYRNIFKSALVYLQNFTKFPKKIQSEFSEHCPYMAAPTFTLFCFILRIFKSTVRNLRL